MPVAPASQGLLITCNRNRCVGVGSAATHCSPDRFGAASFGGCAWKPVPCGRHVGDAEPVLTGGQGPNGIIELQNETPE